ncbi:MAG: WecB/TagA/CpsF family glycosyltransferase [Actinomycetota bacterium]
MPRVDILGVQVTASTMADVCDELARWVDEGERSYVCVTGVHGVMESQRDAELTRIHNESGITTTDGMPLVWLSRRAGVRPVTRVYGPDLMLAIMERSVGAGWSHFFYGGADGVADLLAERLRGRFPGLRVAGTFCPPFRALSDAEEHDVVELINRSGADFVWVGLSTPKQERWMSGMRDRLAPPVLLGVGAAFDFHAGLVRQAPVFIQRSGFEWLFRLAMDPKRLWRRYLTNNPRFIVKVARNRPEVVPRSSG